MSIDPFRQMLKRRRTKIVATLGPATSSPEMIEQLIQAGANVFRLNMSHGDHAFHRETYSSIRSIAQSLGSPVGILADLSGPKIRTGRFAEGGIDLKTGEMVTITTREVPGEPGLIPSQYAALASDVNPGDRILLADGVLELRVESINETEIECLVVDGGRLTDRKGINLPGVEVSAPSLTEKDRVDALFALELGVDLIALSFVRRGADVRTLVDFIREKNLGDPLVIAKIEKPEALANIDEILEVVDGLMVARGDLGVELPLEQVPVVQNELILLARQSNKPVIVATQMLESMIDNPRPTRAEVTDVAQSVSAGTDAIMLSGETAVGSFPVASVRMMDRIARQTEAHLWQQGGFSSIPPATFQTPIPTHQALARAIAQLSRDLAVRAVFCVMRSRGEDARFVSSSRPASPLLVVTTKVEAYQRACLFWGVIPVLVSAEDLQDLPALGRRVLQELELGEAGESFLLVRAIAPGAVEAGNSPEIRVVEI